MATDKEFEVKISGAYALPNETREQAKEDSTKQTVITVSATANSFTTCAVKNAPAFLGHRISMKNMDIAKVDGKPIDLHWYEKSTVAYKGLAANTWTELYKDNYKPGLFDPKNNEIEDFSLCNTTGNRTVDFVILAKMGTGSSFFMNATQATANGKSTLTINYNGVVNAADAEILKTYLGANLSGKATTFASPAAITVTACPTKFSVKNVYYR